MPGPYPWPILARVGQESKTSFECFEPYMVRGVGVGFPGTPDITCGEITIIPASSPPVKRYPALCRIYIQ